MDWNSRAPTFWYKQSGDFLSYIDSEVHMPDEFHSQ